MKVSCRFAAVKIRSPVMRTCYRLAFEVERCGRHGGSSRPPCTGLRVWLLLEIAGAVASLGWRSTRSRTTTQRPRPAKHRRHDASVGSASRADTGNASTPIWPPWLLPGTDRIAAFRNPCVARPDAQALPSRHTPEFLRHWRLPESQQRQARMLTEPSRRVNVVSWTELDRRCTVSPVSFT
jgi:hypothetical protein